MDKQTSWWSRHRPTTRRLVQLYTALLYNALLKGSAEGEIYTGKSKALCVPGLNCYSCPAAVGACPLGALQNAVAASASRPAFYVVGVLLLFGLALGRVICGWACPMGLLQELLHKLPTPKIKKGRITRALTWLKYVLLVVLALAVPLYYAFRRVPVPGFCKYVCPAGTLEGAIALLLHPDNQSKLGLLGILFTRKFVILVLITLACIFLYRAFCRFLCPLGALYGLMSRLALLGVKLDQSRCTDCGACQRVCPMDIRKVGDRECISCGKCIGVCPTSAIQFRAGKAVLHVSDVPAEKTGKRGRRVLTWTLALLVLAGVLIAVNFPASAKPEPVSTSQTGNETVQTTGEEPQTTGETQQTTNAAPAIGSEPGQRLGDFTVERIGGASFTLSEQRGRFVVLNIWATWCGPCVAELPILEEFANTHPDASVLAVHASLITEDVEQWLAQGSCSLDFAIDQDGTVSNLVGASTMLPHTVILDRNGTVLYNCPGSITAALLEDFYSRAS